PVYAINERLPCLERRVMRVGLAVLVFAFLCGPRAFAQPANDDRVQGGVQSDSSKRANYAIDGISLGSWMGTDSRSDREYSCSPSEEFDGFTWCQRTMNGKERRVSYRLSYSVLKSPEGAVLYVSRHQEPAFFTASQFDKDIEKYSREIG